MFQVKSQAQFLLLLVRAGSPPCLQEIALLAGLEGLPRRMPATCSAAAASSARTTWVLSRDLTSCFQLYSPERCGLCHFSLMKYWNQSNLRRWQGSDTCSLVSWNTSVQIQSKWLKHLNYDFLKQVLYPKAAYKKASRRFPNCREDCHSCKSQTKWDSSQQPRLCASLCERHGLSQTEKKVLLSGLTSPQVGVLPDAAPTRDAKLPAMLSAMHKSLKQAC